MIYLHLTKSYRGRTCRPDSTERRKSIIQQGVKQQTQKKILPSTLDMGPSTLDSQKDRLSTDKCVFRESGFLSRVEGRGYYVEGRGYHVEGIKT